MSKSIAASGSAHAYAVPNSKGEYRDGGKTCRITLPGPIPAGQFWSFMVYDGQHRSMLETDQQFAGLDSNQKGIKKNADSLVDGVVSSKGAGGARIQLSADHAGQGLEFTAAPLRAAATMVRQELEAG
jgi:hypothetical protein